MFSQQKPGAEKQDAVGRPSDTDRVVVSGGVVSRLEYVREICDASNFSVKVEGVGPEYFKRVAPVSQNESADASLLLDLLQIKFDDWHESLKSLC